MAVAALLARICIGLIAIAAMLTIASLTSMLDDYRDPPESPRGQR